MELEVGKMFGRELTATFTLNDVEDRAQGCVCASA